MEFAQSPNVGRYRGVAECVFDVVQDKGASVYGAGLRRTIDSRYLAKDF